MGVRFGINDRPRHVGNMRYLHPVHQPAPVQFYDQQIDELTPQVFGHAVELVVTFAITSNDPRVREAARIVDAAHRRGTTSADWCDPHGLPRPS